MTDDIKPDAVEFTEFLKPTAADRNTVVLTAAAYNLLCAKARVCNAYRNVSAKALLDALADLEKIEQPLLDACERLLKAEAKS